MSTPNAPGDDSGNREANGGDWTDGGSRRSPESATPAHGHPRIDLTKGDDGSAAATEMVSLPSSDPATGPAGHPGPPQHVEPHCTEPHYAEPQYGQPQYGQPQYAEPQYGQPQYDESQYGQPVYPPAPPQFEQPQFGQPQFGAPPVQPGYPVDPYASAYGQPGPYGSAPYQPYPPQSARNDSKAIASLAVGILSVPVSLLCCLGPAVALVAIVLGVVSMNEARRTGAPKGMALAGTIIGAVVVVLYIVLMIVLIAVNGSFNWFGAA